MDGGSVLYSSFLSFVYKKIDTYFSSNYNTEIYRRSFMMNRMKA